MQEQSPQPKAGGPKAEEARIVEVCAGVRDFLADIIAPAAPDEVKSLYEATDAIVTLAGKKVRVFPNGYSGIERLARKRKQMEYRAAVVIEVPYLAAASASPDGAIPKAWVDAQVAWVEQNIFSPLDEAFTFAASGLLLGTLTTFRCEVTTVYDPQRLVEEKTFVSVVEVDYRESARG